MNKLLTISALAASLSVAAAANASAWTRNGAVIGPRGTSTVSASGNCAGGTCSRQISRTGPYGGTMSRQGTATCANGTCTGTRTTTGPNGNTITRQRSVSR